MTNENISKGRKRFGRAIIWWTAGVTLIAAEMQFIEQAEFGFTYSRATLYSFRA